jgi:hypothetical protein
LKSYTEFVRSFVSAAEARATVIRAARKPRKKKEKPAGLVVGKMKYLAEDTTFNIKSIKPTEVVGAQLRGFGLGAADHRVVQAACELLGTLVVRSVCHGRVPRLERGF